MKYVLLVCFTIIINLVSSSLIFADEKTIDELAGTCWVYLLVSNDDEGAKQAISMADDKKRAGHFAHKWHETMKKVVNDKVKLNAIVFTADRACKKIGVQPNYD